MLSSSLGTSRLLRHVASSSARGKSSFTITSIADTATPRNSAFFSTNTYEDEEMHENKTGYMSRLFNPTDEHSQLRDMVKGFVEREVR